MESRVPRNRRFLWILLAKGRAAPLDTLLFLSFDHADILRGIGRRIEIKNKHDRNSTLKMILPRLFLL